MMTTPPGHHFIAKIGGGPVPIVGDRAATLAGVAKLPDGRFEDSEWHDGKVILA